MENVLLIVIIAAILAMNIFTVRTSVDTLIISEDLGQNATERYQNNTDRQLRLLNMQDELGTVSRTDYAWHFNQGQKMDLMQEDINNIKEKLGIVENLTYAGPHQDDPTVNKTNYIYNNNSS